MRKKFSKLSKKEREKIESEYHRMKPGDFDDAISAAARQSPNAIRLPNSLVKKLKTIARRRGEAEYRNIVRAWIEERLHHET